MNLFSSPAGNLGFTLIYSLAISNDSQIVFCPLMHAL